MEQAVKGLTLTDNPDNVTFLELTGRLVDGKAFLSFFKTNDHATILITYTALDE
jgi:hypothetical protein